MDEEEKHPLLRKINELTRKANESRFSILVYIATVFVASIWVIFMNPCMMNLLLPILAILIPYKLYDEMDLKKLLVTGIAVIILISLTMAFYHTGVIYDQPSRQIRSEGRRMINGTVEPIYGDSGTSFNLTVELSWEFIERYENRNYTVYANLSFTETEGVRRRDYEGYEMSRVDETVEENQTVEYYVIVTDLPERMFNHYFSLKREVPLEEDDYAWERTSLGFGPITLPRNNALRIITFQQSISTFLFFFLFMGLWWLKRRMDISVTQSTEGLEEKEKALDDSCPECGHLLEGKKECDRCGWVEEPEDEMFEEEEPDI